MTQIFNGVSVDIQPPIASISVNKCHIVVKDSEKLTRISFNNTMDTKNFIKWLAVF